jgi:phosphate-selective porin OprO/OprP
MVTMTSASYEEIINRLTLLESSMGIHDQFKPAGGMQEVDILAKPTLKVSGRVHFDYWGFPEQSDFVNTLATNQDLFGFRRLRFGVKGDVNETMEYKIEMEFANPSRLAFKDAYLGWNELPIFRTLLLGNQKRPYGLDHLNSSRYNVFMERPFVVEAFNQDARRFGLVSYGVSDNQAWNWRWGGYLLQDVAGTGNQYNDNYQSEFAARLANTIWYDEASDGRGYAHWAISGSTAYPNGGTDTARFETRPEARTQNKWYDTNVIQGSKSYQLLGLEGVINVGPLAIVGEYQAVRMQRLADTDVDFGGGYVYAAYFLTGEYQPWSRSSGTIGRVKPLENAFWVRRCDGGCGHGWGAWQIAARYSYGDFTDENVFGGVGNSFTLGMNWWWNPNARVQFNYINGQIEDRNALGTSGDYNIFGTRFMCDF